MADPKPPASSTPVKLSNEQLVSLKELFSKITPEQAGFLGKVNQELEKTEGFLANIDAKFASGTALAKLVLDTTGRVFGSLPDQLVTYSEELRRSVAGNEEFISTIVKQRNELIALGKETARFGVGTKENLLIARQFARENIKLLPIYRDNRNALVDFTARMKAFGLETSESIDIIKNLAGSLNMTGDQLDETRRRLVQFAYATGQSVAEVMKNYGGTINRFMDYLDPAEMDKSFMRFQVMARRMNTETSSLYDFAQKFDTLSSAQELGARLNQTFSSFGVDFNAMVLQEMEPEERIEYLSQKMAEGVAAARATGAKGGRMFMGSLREASGLDANMIRALASEGGMGRATPFERGAALTTLSREEEANRARRENVEAVDRVAAEERMIQMTMQTGMFKKLDGFLDDLGGKLLIATDKLDPLKNAAYQAAIEKQEKAFNDITARLEKIASGDYQISDQAKKLLESQGLDATKLSNLKDVVGALENIAQQDPDNFKKIISNPSNYQDLAMALMGGITAAVKEQIKLMKT